MIYRHSPTRTRPNIKYARVRLDEDDRGHQNPEDTHDEPTQDAPDYYDRLRDSQVEAMRLKR